MINAFLMALLQQAVKAIIGSGLFAEIKNLVALQFSTNKTGAEKQAAVKASLEAAQGDLGVAVKATAQWAINLGIETAVAKVNTAAGLPAKNG
jgi:tRNA A37 N6-isopentenylltransferase MiaA